MENNIRGGDYGWFDRVFIHPSLCFSVYKFLLPDYQERYIVISDYEIRSISHIIDYLFTKMDNALSISELYLKLLADYGVDFNGW